MQTVNEHDVLLHETRIHDMQRASLPSETWIDKLERMLGRVIGGRGGQDLPDPGTYLGFRDVEQVCAEARKRQVVPRIIHRLLLFDADFPDHLKTTLRSFRRRNRGFHHVLWTEADVLSIMNAQEIEIYNSYSRRIQKSDFARYVVLKYHGGIYCDLDVEARRSFSALYRKHRHADLFFEECTLSRDYIEQTRSKRIRNGAPECALRISNYILMARQGSEHIQGILDLCKDRRALPVQEDYDVIYTTGPDVVSTHVDQFLGSDPGHRIQRLSRSDSSRYLRHLCDGHWRTVGS